MESRRNRIEEGSGEQKRMVLSSEWQKRVRKDREEMF